MKPKRPTLADVQGKVAANPTLAALNPHLFPAPTANAAGSPARPDEPQAAPSRPGKRRKEMNKTEALYAKILEVKQSKGEIESFHYEGITLRWGSLDNIQYTPDFAVFIDGKLKKLIETKGAHIWPKDIQKFKAARNQWPQFEFELWQYKDRQWTQLY